MKTFTRFSLAALIAALPVTGFAQTQTDPAPRTSDVQQNRQVDGQRDNRANTRTTDRHNDRSADRMSHNKDNKHKSSARVSKCVGKSVYNSDNKKIGEIEDLVMDGGYNRISYAVISFGGFMGMGEKYFAVPWSSLQHRADQDDRLFINATEQQLKDAPGFDKNNWPDTADATFRSQVDSHYGVRSDAQNTDRTRMGSTARADRAPNNQTTDNNLTNQRTTADQNQQRANAGGTSRPDRVDHNQPSADRSNDRTADQRTTADQNQQRANAGGTSRPDRAAHDSNRSADGSRMGTQHDQRTATGTQRTGDTTHQNHVMTGPTEDGLLWARRVSEVIDADVKNSTDQDVGEIEDLIVDINTGRIVYAVIDLERDMRSSERYAVIPVSKLRTDAQKKEFIINMRRDELQAAPSFNSSRWPDWSDDQFRNRVDRLSDARTRDDINR